MKTVSRFSNSTIVKFAILAVVMISLMAAVAFALWAPSDTVPGITDNGDSLSVDAPEPAPETLTEQGASAKQQFVEGQVGRTGSNEATNLSKSNGVEVVISKESSNIIVVTKINGVSDGTCSLSISNRQASFKSTADVIYQSSYSTCAGFSVPKDKLGPGTWRVLVSVTSLSGTRLSGSGDIEV